MNINAKIDWKSGLELTSGTFITLDNSIDKRLLSISRIVNGNLFGIVPSTAFNNSAIFVKKQIEFTRLQCTALLPSGRVVEIDDSVAINIPMLYGDEYYVAVSLGDDSLKYELESIPLTKPTTEYGLYTREQLEGADLMPLLKLLVKDGIFSIDSSYIPPLLQIDSAERYGDFIELLSDALAKIAEHPNLESGEGQRAMMRYSFQLKGYRSSSRVADFVAFIQEIAQALEYYVVKPNSSNYEKIPECNLYDVANWLDLITEYLSAVTSILDKVVLEDKSIDLEKLKQELSSELYEKIYTNLYATLTAELIARMHNEIKVEIKDKLEEYINGEFKRKIYQELKVELSQELTSALFDDLYTKLYNALYVQEEEVEDGFMPLI